MKAADLPALCYVGDHIVGVVSDCHCPPDVHRAGEGDVITADPAHESHDIVPPRCDGDLPEGVDFEHYKRWCRMFAAAPDLLAACKAIRAALERYGTQVDDLFGHDEQFNAALESVEGAIAKAEPPTPKGTA